VHPEETTQAGAEGKWHLLTLPLFFTVAAMSHIADAAMLLMLHLLLLLLL